MPGSTVPQGGSARSLGSSVEALKEIFVDWVVRGDLRGEMIGLYVGICERCPRGNDGVVRGEMSEAYDPSSSTYPH